MTAAQRLDNERKERLCIDGVTGVELYSMEGATPADLAEDLPAALDLVEGLILYAQLLETFMLVKANVDPSETRTKAKQTASAWRGVPTQQEGPQ